MFLGQLKRTCFSGRMVSTSDFYTNRFLVEENMYLLFNSDNLIKTKNKNKSKAAFTKTNDFIKDESVLVEMFNNHYINIVEKTSCIVRDSRGDSLPENDEETVSKILKHENHPSVSKIKYNQNETLNFDFPTSEVEDINKIIKSLNTRKATGPDGIPVKILKIARYVIDLHLTNISRDIYTQTCIMRDIYTIHSF